MQVKSLVKQRKLVNLLACICILITAFRTADNRVAASYSNNFFYNDSVLFTPNSAEGWGSYFSYLGDEGDSVELELILYRDVQDSIDWTFASEIGTISTAYTPLSVVVIEYLKFSRTWRIIIRPDGKCFIQLLMGLPPSGNPAGIPIKTKYKKQ